MNAKDKRIRFMNELLNGIKVDGVQCLFWSNFKRNNFYNSTLVFYNSYGLWVQVVKLYAWEKAFSKVISDYRLGEIAIYIRFYILNAFSMHHALLYCNKKNCNLLISY